MNISDHLHACPNCTKPSIHFSVDDWEYEYCEHVLACPHCLFLDYAVYSSGAPESLEFESRPHQWQTVIRYFGAKSFSELRELTLNSPVNGKPVVSYENVTDLSVYCGLSGDKLFNKDSRNRWYYLEKRPTTKMLVRHEIQALQNALKPLVTQSSVVLEFSEDLPF
ncbi:hypothetical protein NI385_26495 (plasmid) [Vibrio parahaemolyticus]|nr:hypothetical protein NI385_26495 [Vibrio parahaemolyticus]